MGDKQSVSQLKAYYRGIRDGVWLYAWWKDGVEYVGTSGKTLKEAREKIDSQEQEELAALKMRR